MALFCLSTFQVQAAIDLLLLLQCVPFVVSLIDLGRSSSTRRIGFWWCSFALDMSYSFVVHCEEIVATATAMAMAEVLRFFPSLRLLINLPSDLCWGSLCSCYLTPSWCVGFHWILVPCPQRSSQKEKMTDRYTGSWQSEVHIIVV